MYAPVVAGDSSVSDETMIKITPSPRAKPPSTTTKKETELPFIGNAAVGNNDYTNNTTDFDNNEVRLSIHENNVAGSVLHRRSNASGNLGRQGDPTTSFKRRSSLLSIRSNSRLIDTPGHDHDHDYTPTPTTGKKSGILGVVSEADEDDPFWEDDLPEEYKKMKLSVFTLIEIVSLILLIIALICSIAIKAVKKISVFKLGLWKWLLMILVLICGRLLSGWCIRIVVLIIERNCMLRKRVLYFVYGLKKAVQNCIWLALVLIAWQNMFDPRVENSTNGNILPYITRIWVCLLVGTFIWLLKTLLLKVLASSFHVSAYFDRIQESLFNQYVIQTLSGPPLIEIQRVQKDEESVLDEVQNLQNAGARLPPSLKESLFHGRKVFSRNATFDNVFSGMIKKEEDKGITIDHLHRLNQKNISAWNMKRLMKIVRKGALSTLDEKWKDSTMGVETTSGDVDGDGDGDGDITSEKNAKAAAKKIFYNVAQPNSKFIYQVDFMRFMKVDEASKTFRLFEGTSESKGVGKSALKSWLVNAFRERRALALSLNDTKTAVNKLHQMLNVVVAVIMIVISLLILKVTTSRFFIFFSSQILLIVFIFGETCKTTFEAIIFLFIMHPFDVGDRVDVDGLQMVVEEMNILTTVFLRFDNLKIIYPNSVLSKKFICNYYRSPDMGEGFDFSIHISTPEEKIALMKERITRCIEENSEHWQPTSSITLRYVEDMNRMKYKLWLSHTINHQDMGERWSRRSVLFEKMVTIFKDLNIEYRMLPHDVNVQHIPPLNTSSRLPSNWTVCSTT